MCLTLHRWLRLCSVMSGWSPVRSASTLQSATRWRERVYAAGQTAASSFAQRASVPSMAPENAPTSLPNAAASEMYCLEVLRANATSSDCEGCWVDAHRLLYFTCFMWFFFYIVDLEDPFASIFPGHTKWTWQLFLRFLAQLNVGRTTEFICVCVYVCIYWLHAYTAVFIDSFNKVPFSMYVVDVSYSARVEVAISLPVNKPKSTFLPSTTLFWTNAPDWWLNERTMSPSAGYKRQTIWAEITLSNPLCQVLLWLSLPPWQRSNEKVGSQHEWLLSRSWFKLTTAALISKQISY